MKVGDLVIYYRITARIPQPILCIVLRVDPPVVGMEHRLCVVMLPDGNTKLVSDDQLFPVKSPGEM